MFTFLLCGIAGEASKQDEGLLHGLWSENGTPSTFKDSSDGGCLSYTVLACCAWYLSQCCFVHNV